MTLSYALLAISEGLYRDDNDYTRGGAEEVDVIIIIDHLIQFR